MTTTLSEPPPVRARTARQHEVDPRSAGDATPRAHRAVVFEADDLGLLYSFNEGIRLCHQEGCLTSTCLRANGHAYEHALAEVLPDCPHLGLGIHLCLNEAGCVAPPERVPLLLGPDGQQQPGFGWLMKLARTAAGREQIERELRAQVEKILCDGVRVDHINSHKHVHMIPRIFEITCRLAREYEISCVRLSREPMYSVGGPGKRFEPLANANYIKNVLLNRFAQINASTARAYGLLTTDCFVGVNYTGAMDIRTVTGGLTAAGDGTVEVLMHPTVPPDPRDRPHTSPFYAWYVPAAERRAEFDVLTSPELPAFLCAENWAPTTYGALVKACRRPGLPRTTPQVDGRVREVCNTISIRNPVWVSAAHETARAFAQLVVAQTGPGDRVLDVGTGTGIIAIALAKCGAKVTATDLCPSAVKNARANAARNSVRFECIQSDLLDAVDGRFDLIAMNPPYNFKPDTFAMNVAKGLLRRVPWVHHNSARLPTGVLRFHQQLVRRLVEQAPAHLNDGAAILLHAYENEVDALSRVLPAGATVQILDHPDLHAIRTVGMLVHLCGA